MKVLIKFTCCVVCALVGLSCAHIDTTFAEPPPLKVVTTTGIIADLCQQLGGPLIEVHPLMGPGVDPHLYKATHGDLVQLRTADAIIYNGLHLEGKLAGILEALGSQKPIFALGDSLPHEQLLVIDSASNSVDPHIWFDVSLFRLTVPHLTQFLKQQLPSHSAEIEARELELLQRLDSLHQWARSTLARIRPERRVLVTAHDAFSYFGRAYGMEVHGLQGVSTAVEYGVHDITRIVNLVVERKLPAIFVESSVPQRFVEAIISGARAKGHTVVLGGQLYSDALGEPGSGADTYLDMVQYNVQRIVEALGPKVD